MRELTGIVLCGGRSRRMGVDKAALPFGGETLLHRAVRVVALVASEVIVVTRADQVVTGVAARIIHDPVEDLGPLAGLAAGLSASTTELNVVVACDMPLVRAAVLQRLAASIGDADACVAVVDGRPSPLCAVYRTRVAAVANQLLGSGERRAMALLNRLQTKRVDAAVFRDIDPDLETFTSCNTPDELSAAKAALKCRPSGA